MALTWILGRSSSRSADASLPSAHLVVTPHSGSVAVNTCSGERTQGWRTHTGYGAVSALRDEVVHVPCHMTVVGRMSAFPDAPGMLLRAPQGALSWVIVCTGDVTHTCAARCSPCARSRRGARVHTGTAPPTPGLPSKRGARLSASLSPSLSFPFLFLREYLKFRFLKHLCHESGLLVAAVENVPSVSILDGKGRAWLQRPKEAEILHPPCKLRVCCQFAGCWQETRDSRV